MPALVSSACASARAILTLPQPIGLVGGENVVATLFASINVMLLPVRSPWTRLCAFALDPAKVENIESSRVAAVDCCVAVVVVIVVVVVATETDASFAVSAIEAPAKAHK